MTTRTEALFDRADQIVSKTVVSIEARDVICALSLRLQGAEKVMEAFETERKAGRFSCECEWAPDEYTTLVRRCVTHEALDGYQDQHSVASEEK